MAYAAVFVKGDAPEAQVLATRVTDYLAERGLGAVVGLCPDEQVAAAGGMDPRAAEFAVVLGGDGTILYAAEQLLGSDVPIFGVNLGHVGFLAEAREHEITAVLDALIAGNYTTETRATLAVQVVPPALAASPAGESISPEAAGETNTTALRSETVGETFTGWALNEVAIEKQHLQGERSGMINVRVEVDGSALSSYGADGLIVATATGSTAHAFSAGGPVIWPDVEAIEVVPVAAHALFSKPLVVSSKSEVVIYIDESPSKTAAVTFDGRRRLSIPTGTVITVRQNDSKIKFARISAAPFTERLVEKFQLPVDGWRG
jgi:NAD+ kinase